MTPVDLFHYIHPTPYVWWIGMFLGLCWGLYRYGRSMKYLYFYYIEHGKVVWSLDNYESEMKAVIKKNKLYEHFSPHGYVSGMGIVCLTTAFGLIASSLWPVTLVIGILTVPNIILRFVAKDKRKKVIFVQDLKAQKASK